MCYRRFDILERVSGLALRRIKNGSPDRRPVSRRTTPSRVGSGCAEPVDDHTHARRPDGPAGSTRPTHPTPQCRGAADPPEHGKIFVLASHATQAFGGRLAIRGRCRRIRPALPHPSNCRPVASEATVCRRSRTDRALRSPPEIRTHVEQSRRQHDQLGDARRPR